MYRHDKAADRFLKFVDRRRHRDDGPVDSVQRPDPVPVKRRPPTTSPGDEDDDGVLRSAATAFGRRAAAGTTGSRTLLTFTTSCIYPSSSSMHRQSTAFAAAGGRRAELDRLAELNLLCAETLTSSRAADDRKRVDDGGRQRVLNGLLDAESRCQLASNPYVAHPEINENMRKQLADWIYQICDAKCRNDGVFAQAMYLVDRFVGRCTLTVRRTEFQLIGAVCLFIASKLVDCSEDSAMTASRVADYTDNSVTKAQLLDWELVVLQEFDWDVFAITPFDFVDHIICHLSLGDDSIVSRVRHHTVTFVALCALDANLSTTQPSSTVAAACIRHAVSATLGEAWCRVHRIDHRLHRITQTEPEFVANCRDQIERLLLAGLSPRGPRDRRETPSDIQDINPDDSCGPFDG